MNTMRVFCINLPESSERTEKAKAHFKERMVYDVTFFPGIHAERFGLLTSHCYEVDNPGSGYKIGHKQIGIALSHYMLWNALTLLADEHFLVIEDDAQFPENWHTRLTQAMSDVPRDFDALYIGSCCTCDKSKYPIKGEVFEVKYPFCTHAIIWAKKALPVLLETQRKIWAPIDLALVFQTLPKLKVYTVLPAIVGQFDTVFPA